MKVEKREYKDHEGNKIVEFTHRGMRLRVYVNPEGKKLFNYSDIETLKGYSAEDVFSFLYIAMGDELFNYVVGGGKA